MDLLSLLSIDLREQSIHALAWVSREVAAFDSEGHDPAKHRQNRSQRTRPERLFGIDGLLGDELEEMPLFDLSDVHRSEERHEMSVDVDLGDLSERS